MADPTLYCLFFSDRFIPCMPQAEWAGWAQAVFSVIAILIAVWIARFQVSRQHAHQRDTDLAAAKVLVAGWEIPIAIGVRQALDLKDTATRSIKRELPLHTEDLKKQLKEIVLPGEDQILRLAAAAPKAAVALASAAYFLSVLEDSLDYASESATKAAAPERFIEMRSLMLRQWSKFIYLNLRIAQDELAPLRIERFKRKKWWKRIYFRFRPAAALAALEQESVENGFYDSIPLEPDKSNTTTVNRRDPG